MGDAPPTTTPKPDLNLALLQAELARIDVLIRHEVRRWQIAGQDPNDAFRGLYVSDGEVGALLQRPQGVSWGQTVQLEPEESQAFADALAQAVRQLQAISELSQREDTTLRLVHLANTFGLDRFAVDTLFICLAPTLDLRYERLYGYLQDDVTRKRPTVNLVLNLLCEPGPNRLLFLTRFADSAPLFKHGILERTAEAGAPLLSHTLHVDQAIVSWLLGTYRPHAALGAHATLNTPQADPADALLAGERIPNLEPAGDAPLVVLSGPDEVAREAATRLIAHQLGRPLLAVDLAAVVSGGLAPLRALQLALRDARLTGAVPCLLSWDVCLGPEHNDPPPADLLAELFDHPGPAIVSGEAIWLAKGVERKRNLLWLEFPLPDTPARHALWQHYLGPDSLDVTPLAGQFILTSGQIRDAAASARDRAAQANRKAGDEDLFAAARTHSNPRLASLARKITPRFGWDDIVLPADQLAILREIIATVRGRPLVLEQWGVGKKLASSAGVTVLFSGEPGTGKTMAAEIIAAELGLDLYKIDLSTVVSKYIGETEKNLERIFGEAQSSNAILFFDEADAIFGKRSEVKDAHDRYANIEISYLLQRMEAYDGVTILATNLRANLDEAFTRRLQFVVDLPFPEEADRLHIWQTLFPPGVPCTDEIDLALLARRFKIAGGNIRNILVSASFLAAADSGQVTMKHLLHGTRRELQKMGRLISDDDLKVG